MAGLDDGNNTTTGNNVDVFLDRNGDFQPDRAVRLGSPNGVFDLPINLNADPSTYSDRRSFTCSIGRTGITTRFTDTALLKRPVTISRTISAVAAWAMTRLSRTRSLVC